MHLSGRLVLSPHCHTPPLCHRPVFAPPLHRQCPHLCFHRHVCRHHCPLVFIEDYLVNRCNLYANVAARVAPELSAIRSPSKPDAVLAFLANTLELSPPLIAVAVARDPTILTCSVPRTLAPRAEELRALGFTAFQMGLIVARCGAAAFRSRALVPSVQFWLPYLRGRVDKLVAALKGNPGLLTADLRTVKSTVALLQEEGTLTDGDVGWFAISYCSKLLVASPDEVDSVLARADEFGVPRKTRAFKDAIIAAFSVTPERLAWKVAFFRDELGWTEAQVKTAAAKMPTLLTVSAERIRRNWEFLTTEVGMDAERVASANRVVGLDGRDGHAPGPGLTGPPGLLQVLLDLVRVRAAEDEGLLHPGRLQPCERVLDHRHVHQR